MKNKRILFCIAPVLCMLLTGCGEKPDVEKDVKTLTLYGPENGAVIDTMPREERNYVDAMYAQAQGIQDDYIINDLNGDSVKIKNYTTKITCCKDVPITLSFKHDGFGEGKSYNLYYSTNENFEGAKKITTTEKNIEVHNLFTGTQYYWKVTSLDGSIQSDVKTFTTKEGTRGLEAGMCPNVRDMGGHMTKFGKRIKQGLIYRGAELVEQTYVYDGSTHNRTMDRTCINTFRNDMKIGIDLDFRGEGESNNLAGSPLGYNVVFDRQPITSYGKLLTHSSASFVKQIFKDFLQCETKPVYYHCMGGADRTGTIGFILGAVLGMSYTDLIIDFELTSYSNNYRPHDEVVPHSDFPSLIAGLKALPAYTPTISVQELVESWLTSDSVGVTHAQIEQLRNIMLED